mgnify:CR=1 FL=1
MQKTDDQWQNSLKKDAYQVARCGATEAPFSGKYNDHKEQGTYICICCENSLFSSTAKYDSGSGWPSYYAAINDQALSINRDTSHNMIRDEVKCSHCDAHLGHLFTDGPPPTGLRYCINSLSLGFKNKEI